MRFSENELNKCQFKTLFSHFVLTEQVLPLIAFLDSLSLQRARLTPLRDLIKDS